MRRRARSCRIQNTQWFENVVEDEQHFLVNCKTFESIRQNYFNLIEQKDPSFVLTSKSVIPTGEFVVSTGESVVPKGESAVEKGG